MAHAPRDRTCKRCGLKFTRAGLKQHRGSLRCDAMTVERQMWRAGFIRYPAPGRVWRALRLARVEVRRGYGQYKSGVSGTGGSYVRSCDFVEPWAAAVATVMVWPLPSARLVTDPRMVTAARVIRWCEPTTPFVLYTVPWLLAVVLTHEWCRGVVRVPAHLPCGRWFPGPPRLLRSNTTSRADALFDDSELRGQRWVFPDATKSVEPWRVWHTIHDGDHLLDPNGIYVPSDNTHCIRIPTGSGVQRDASRAELLRQLLLDVARQG
jgi:hypothetical protein